MALKDGQQVKVYVNRTGRIQEIVVCLKENPRERDHPAHHALLLDPKRPQDGSNTKEVHDWVNTHAEDGAAAKVVFTSRTMSIFDIVALQATTRSVQA